MRAGRLYSLMVLVGAVALLHLHAPASAVAQDHDPRLQAALSQAQEGNSDSARAAVQTILASTPANDPLYPEALYTAGLIANNAQQAQRYFRRVALEYGFSPWADDALLRIVQLRYAARDIAGTVRAAEQLLADYPTSDALAEAAYWAARASVDRNESEAACNWVAVGLANAGDNIEAAN